MIYTKGNNPRSDEYSAFNEQARYRVRRLYYREDEDRRRRKIEEWRICYLRGRL
jgi:hypothetical protein